MFAPDPRDKPEGKLPAGSRPDAAKAGASPGTKKESPARCALRRLRHLETKYDRRIAVTALIAVAYVTAWLVLRATA